MAVIEERSVARAASGPPEDTRSRVLDATVELLAERGYAGTTTRLAAARAGVSQGALQHHFRSRSDLCVSAMSLLVQRLSGEFRSSVPSIEDPVERFGAIADRLMEVFRGPTFVAGLELRLAARTDPALREALRGLDRELDDTLESGAIEMLPELASRPGFSDLLEATMASIRGVAVAHMVPDPGPGSSWEAVRRRLVDSASRLETVR